MIIINGVADDRICILDRGLHYGDGLFETIAYRNGIAEFLEVHLQRLVSGCEQLNIPFQQLEQLRAELKTVCQASTGDMVIKIIITRGSGGRGYFADKDNKATRIISTHAYPNYPDSNVKGIAIRFCQHRLSENTVLAGIKHLNRLDQVLARNEWNDSDILEGLMCDQNNNVIEGTMSNLFIVKSNQIITPLLIKSGVSGVMRAQIIRLVVENKLFIEETVVTQDDVIAADEVFICNSVIGIWPVTYIVDSNTHYSVGAITQQLQGFLQKVNK